MNIPKITVTISSPEVSQTHLETPRAARLASAAPAAMGGLIARKAGDDSAVRQVGIMSVRVTAAEQPQSAEGARALAERMSAVAARAISFQMGQKIDGFAQTLEIHIQTTAKVDTNFTTSLAQVQDKFRDIKARAKLPEGELSNAVMMELVKNFNTALDMLDAVHQRIHDIVAEAQKKSLQNTSVIVKLTIPKVVDVANAAIQLRVDVLKTSMLS